MKKIFANVFSLRGVLTVLCACMASEALADLVDPLPSYTPLPPHISLPPYVSKATDGFWLLPVIIAMLLIVSIIWGCAALRSGKNAGFARCAQLLLLGIELILWKIIIAGNLFNPVCNLLFLLWFILIITASLISGIWTYQKKTDPAPDSVGKKWFNGGAAKKKNVLLQFLLIDSAVVMIFLFICSLGQEIANFREWERREKQNQREWERREKQHRQEWEKRNRKKRRWATPPRRQESYKIDTITGL